MDEHQTPPKQWNHYIEEIVANYQNKVAVQKE